eukprot:GHVU01077968.1.p1 GENE.GHVU01077968.1~~GHVU01077968.1.p1  ORF type:complete len:164 (-),score=16.87 GHVU01077968.1:997-1488(-)
MEETDVDVDSDSDSDSPTSEDKIPAVIRESLCQVKLTADGTGFAFVRLNCKGKGIEDIPKAIQNYVELRFLDFSNNEIDDISRLMGLPHVLSLNVSENKLYSAIFPEGSMPFCQRVDLSNNVLDELDIAALPRLARLSLASNRLTSINTLAEHKSLRVGQINL